MNSIDVLVLGYLERFEAGSVNLKETWSTSSLIRTDDGHVIVVDTSSDFMRSPIKSAFKQIGKIFPARSYISCPRSWTVSCFPLFGISDSFRPWRYHRPRLPSAKSPPYRHVVLIIQRKPDCFNVYAPSGAPD